MNNQRIDIENYCLKLKNLLLSEFGERLCYMGLQGSYLRGEATADSDIDIMVILDCLTIADMDTYRRILAEAGHADKACGFICCKEDMAHWNPMEICQLLHTTRDLFGILAEWVPSWTMDDEMNYIRLSLNNLYHGICHKYIHGQSSIRKEELMPFYKSAFFILQNICFAESYRPDAAKGEFILAKEDLIKRLKGEDRAVLEALAALADGADTAADQLFSQLFLWCRNKMAQVA